jgi:hypothetical protein
LKTTFVLVDFENVQPKNVSVLRGGSSKIKIFLGAHQARIPVETASALQGFGPDAEYIRIAGGGRNALDFLIAYYLGRLVAESPSAQFHVISKDTGFDPLIRHLTAHGISCQRSKSLGDISQVKIPTSQSISERVDAVIANLAKRKAAKPRTLKTLRSTISARFLNRLTDEELDEIVEELKERGAITVADSRVHYEPSPAS